MLATFKSSSNQKFGRATALVLSCSTDKGDREFKIFQFGDSKAVADSVKEMNLQAGERIDLTMKQNDKGYWNVTEVKRVEGTPSTPAASSSGLVASGNSFSTLKMAAEFYDKAKSLKMPVEDYLLDVMSVASVMDAYFKGGHEAATAILAEGLGLGDAVGSDLDSGDSSDSEDASDSPF